MPHSSAPFVLHMQQWFAQPIGEIFEFFADANNLERITPAFLRFHVLTPSPIEMKVGTLIDYKLRVRGFPVRWQSEITAWEPPHRFIDEQRRGPYRLWHHEHTFVSKEGGTLVTDHVQYRVPGGSIINRLFVRPDIDRIFAFRKQTLETIFPTPLVTQV